MDSKAAPTQKVSSALISAAIGTGVAELATLPICTVKTNYQNSNRSMSKVIVDLWKQRGWIGFYSASFWAVGGQIMTTSLKYTGYQVLRDPVPNRFLAGGISGAIVATIIHPIEVCKVHYQMNRPLRSEVLQHGLKLFYRGYSKALTKSVIGSSCFYPLRDTFQDHIKIGVLASLLSAVVSTTIMQPLDYMKIRHIAGLSWFDRTNFRVYFRGYWLNLSRIVPHFIITMEIIDWIK